MEPMLFATVILPDMFKLLSETYNTPIPPLFSIISQLLIIIIAMFLDLTLVVVLYFALPL